MPRNSDNTRRRLIEAATDEFAAYGIAGARVDRIAQKAKCNKQAIYAYYGSKEALFNTVYECMTQDIAQNVVFDIDNLPDFAEKLHVYYTRNAYIMRLTTWYRLEKGGFVLPEGVLIKHIGVTESIKEAQRRGTINDLFTAEELYMMILVIATMGTVAPPAADKYMTFSPNSVKVAVQRLIEK